MKQLVTTLLIIATISQGISQIGINLAYIKGSGDLGYVYKPTAGIDLRYNLSGQEDHLKVGITLGFFELKPRYDNYPFYGIRTEYAPN